jgi:hypothetical protein
MRAVTKLKCLHCRKRFKPPPRGRTPLYCSASCRQRAYEKRKWTPYGARDALTLDLLPWAAKRYLERDVRHLHMIELIKHGTVPLVDQAQIDGLLDYVKTPERLPLLRQIEAACHRRGDEQALATITRWRLARQNR